MKNIIFCLVIILFATSCAKQPAKYCWTCTVNITYTPSYGAHAGTSTTTICDKTQDEIRNVEKSGTITSTGSYAGYTVTTHQTTNCSK